MIFFLTFQGLELELDIQQKEYVELTEDAGIVLHISPRGQMAFPFEEGLSLAPGFSTSIGLRRVIIKSIQFLRASVILYKHR